MAITKTAQLDPKLVINQSSTVFGDFYDYTSGGTFTTVAASSGTTAADDTGGTDQVKLTTAATLNDYQGVKSTKQNFLMNSGTAMYSETYLNFTSQSSNNATVGAGFTSDPTTFASSTADPSGSYSGAIIYRLSGDTSWRCQSSNGSTKTTSQSSNAPCADGYHVLRVDIVNWDSATNAQVIYTVDNQLLKDSNGQVIRHTVAFSGLVKMGIFAQTVAASANAQVCNVDYMGAGKFRNLLQGFQS